VSVTGGTGVGATFNLQNPPRAFTVQVASGVASPPAGTGSGYALNDLLTVQGGNFTTQAVLKVTGIVAATGAITTVTVQTAGSYYNDGTQPTANVAVTGGAGS